MDWSRFLLRKPPKSPEQLVDETDIESVIGWCRSCHEKHPVDWTHLHGVLSSFPAWYAIPAFLALKKIGFDHEAPADVVDPIASELASDATHALSGRPASDPEMSEVLEAMVPNMIFWTRIWLAAFQKVKMGYFKDRDIVDAMFRIFLRQESLELKARFVIRDVEDEQAIAETFGAFICRCYAELPRFH